MTSPHFCDMILSELCFNCLHGFYAMPTNRQLDHSFPAVLDIFGKGLNLPALLNIQWPKCFKLQGGFAPWPHDQRLCPWTPLGALPPDPLYRLALPRLPCAPPNLNSWVHPPVNEPPLSKSWIRRCSLFMHDDARCWVMCIIGRQRGYNNNPRSLVADTRRITMNHATNKLPRKTALNNTTQITNL